MKVGDTVRIVEDEHPELVGLTGRIERLSADGTAAWVASANSPFGVWCSVSSLEVAT